MMMRQFGPCQVFHSGTVARTHKPGTGGGGWGIKARRGTRLNPQRWSFKHTLSFIFSYYTLQFTMFASFNAVGIFTFASLLFNAAIFPSFVSSAPTPAVFGNNIPRPACPAAPNIGAGAGLKLNDKVCSGTANFYECTHGPGGVGTAWSGPFQCAQG
jgi:hypothetical protein